MVGINDIDALQQRINAALTRLGTGLDALSPADDGGTADLQAALDEERTANAQLQERLAALTEKQAAELDALQGQHQDMVAQVGALDLELQRLRQANVQLRESNAALREANQAGVAEPHLINTSMLAELEAIRAARAADVAEASAILSALAPALSAGEEADA